MTERRIESRCLCADLVRLSWAERTVDAVLEDISALGGCVQVEAAIPLGTAISLSIGETIYRGHVSYCVFRDYGYFVGLRFAEDKTWSADEVVPQHLVNLEVLLRTAAAEPRP